MLIKNELAGILVSIPKTFYEKYKNYDAYFDVEQLCFDVLIKSLARFDWVRWRDLKPAINQFVKIYETRLRYHIRNELKKYRNQTLLLEKIAAQEMSRGYEKDEVVVVVELAVEKVVSEVKYGEDAIEVLCGFTSLTEVAQKHKVSVQCIRHHVIRAKKVAYNFIEGDKSDGTRRHDKKSNNRTGK